MNVLAPEFWTDPYPAFAELRDEGPVRWHDECGLWTIARHDDVMRISRDPATFCSGRGVLPSDRQRDVDPAASILFLDPPDHHRHRKLVSPAFTPRRISALEDRVRRLANELLDQVDADGAVDFAPAVAEPLPMLVIADMLGVPASDRDQFKLWSDAMIEAATEPTEATYALAFELWQYFEKIIEQRRVDPADDLISVIAGAEVDDVPLTNAELNGFCMTLLVAGNETTRNLIAHSVLALIEHPEAKAELAANLDDEALWNSATEEFLRWGSSIQNFRRTVTRDTEVAGQPLATGEKVVIYYMSANRDERVFDDPHRFDIHRSPNDHLTFGGGGAHFCLGANLARAEIRILVRELLRRHPNVDLAGPPRRMRSDFINGIKELPVQLEPA